jgi:acetyl-CoA carboxylase alpha subunit
VEVAADNLRQSLRRYLDEFAGLEPERLVEHRYSKFRKMGNFFA